MRLADGKRKRVRFSPNHDASALMLAELLKRIENEKAGVVDRYTAHRKRRLADLLADYARHQRDRGNTDKQSAWVVRRCELVFEGCGFVLHTDLDAPTAERWLADRRSRPKTDGGFSSQTVNHYVTALKAFGNWLVKARIAVENVFRFLHKVNVEVDVRRVRRPLVGDEFDRLLRATATRKPYRGVCGPDRVELYAVAAYTGLRASELASHTPSSFHLDADPPTLTVAAAYSKHRREDIVPSTRRWSIGSDRGCPGRRSPSACGRGSGRLNSQRRRCSERIWKRRGRRGWPREQLKPSEPGGSRPTSSRTPTGMGAPPTSTRCGTPSSQTL